LLQGIQAMLLKAGLQQYPVWCFWRRDGPNPSLLDYTAVCIPCAEFTLLLQDEKQSGRTVHRAAYCCRVFLHAVPLLEAIHTAAGIHQLLLAGEEGVTLGADVHAHLLLDGAGFKGLAAYAAHSGFLVLGMDVFLHGDTPLQRCISDSWRATMSQY